MSARHQVICLLLPVLIASSDAAVENSVAQSKQPEPAQAKPLVDLFGDPLPPGTLARMGTIRLRPGATPGHLLFSADSKQLICFAGGHGSADALVCYEVASGKELR